MAVDLCTRLMERLQRSSTELKLTTRLQCNALAALSKSDDFAVFQVRLPIVPVSNALEEGGNLVVRRAAVVLDVITELLMLCSYPAACI